MGLFDFYKRTHKNKPINEEIQNAQYEQEICMCRFN